MLFPFRVLFSPFSITLNSLLPIYKPKNSCFSQQSYFLSARAGLVFLEAVCLIFLFGRRKKVGKNRFFSSSLYGLVVGLLFCGCSSVLWRGFWFFRAWQLGFCFFWGWGGGWVGFEWVFVGCCGVFRVVGGFGCGVGAYEVDSL